nr:xylulose kinase-1 [Tanacetum cinerariifolium]
MIAILEKSEHNIDFHHIVDFVKASHIRYDLTINPNVYVSRIRQFWSTARIETMNEGTKILATVDDKPMTISESSIRRNLKLNDKEGGEGAGTLTEPHHTPSLQEKQFSSHHDLSPSHPTVTTKTIPTKTPIEVPTLRKYSRRDTHITQSKALPTAADEPAFLLRDDSQGEALPTVSGLDAGHDRENIIMTSALPHDLTPRVTSLNADEGNLEISSLKAMIKLLKDKDRGSAEPTGDDATIKGRSMKIGEEEGVEKSTKQGSNDTKELVNVLTSMDAANILTSEVQAVCVPPVAEVSTVGVPTGSGHVPTVRAIFTTASVVTSYSRRPRGISAKNKGKEKMVESDTPKKKKVQEQIDV